MEKGLFYVMLIWLTLSGCNDTINEVLLEESAPRIIESNQDKAVCTAIGMEWNCKWILQICRFKGLF